ncbi:restriction endonuclease subunit S [Leptolyngbyaceae cyanobacterium CCMR0082]|uniref:Restriction endonuclease subunit S n=1 Tax=Adonisia turfae CCMR0082 TaxID=2304604 RepID=A0A6M0S9B5_9CYAN|nr:hypothetical protein [Adonisia turfae]NEZ64673.1 restriction endonuclease subunit S [Adonisia turfae CCMR0082]
MVAVYLTESISSATVRALNYTPEVEAFRKRGDSENSLTLGELVSGMGESYGKVFVRYDCESGYGEELLTQSDMFASETCGRIIRGAAIPRLEQQRLSRWQVLIAGAGTLGETELYGRSIIVDKRLEGKIIGPHAIRLTFPEPGNDISLYAYAFLCSPTGIRLVRSTSYGTKILSLREDLLRSLPIPLSNKETLKKVAELIRTTVKEREKYLEEIQAARACVEALPEMQDAIAMCQERKGRCVVWDSKLSTMTGWTYASAGKALGYLQKKWKSRLGDVVERDGIYNGPRFARVSCLPPYGVDFLSQRDVFLIRPVPRRIRHPGFVDRLLFCPPGTLLLGGHGTLGEREIFGRVNIADESWIHTAFTQDILRIITSPHFSFLSYSYLSTLVGLRLMRSCAVGTKILSLRSDLIRALPFPEVSKELHQKINDHMQSAIQARLTAANAEKEAVRIIEEEVLPEWLA